MRGLAPVASLPMYDWPEVAWATDALWTAIAARLRSTGIAAPDTLDRSRPSEAVWNDPGLVLSQTCGYPYATRLAGKVRLVGTPVYAAEGCDGPFYSSVIVVRRGEGGTRDLTNLTRRIAFNARDSLSGYVALHAWMREKGGDPAAGEWLETGSHRASLQAVASGNADLAAVDAVCWSLARRHDPDTAALEVLAWTEQRPGLPLVTARARSELEVRLLQTAIADVISDRGAREILAALLLTGCAEVAAVDYDAIARLGD